MTRSPIAVTIPATVLKLSRSAGAASAIAAGQAHVISISPVRDAFGSRWSKRQTVVSDFVLRSFQRQALSDDLILSLNDVDFILFQPSSTPSRALHRASQLIRDTLGYFLGESHTAKICVAVMDQLEGDVIQTHTIDSSSPDGSLYHRAGDLTSANDGSPPWERFTVGHAASAPVMVRGPTGQDLEAIFYLEPIWNARASVVASFLVQSAVFEVTPAGARLPPHDDLLTTQCHIELTRRRIEYLKQTFAAAADPFVAHLPIPAPCLRLSSPRSWLLSALRRELGGVHRNVVIELCDLPEGFPNSALSALVAQATPYSRAVLARISDSERAPRSRCGLNGVVRQIEGPTDDRLLARELQAFASAARRLRVASAVYGLRTRSQVLTARAAGVTHLSGPAITEAFGAGATPRRFRLEDRHELSAEPRMAAVA